jgi:hypothetical protein
MSFEQDVQALRTWLESKTPRSLVLVVGTPGCGASSTLTSLLEELDIESVWLTPGVQKLRASLHDAGSSFYSATGRRKVVVVDGFDAIMGDANSAADVGDFVRRALPAPTVCLAHRTRTIIKRFRELFNAASRPRAAVIELHPLSPVQIAEIVRQKHPSISENDAMTLAQQCNGNIKSAISSLAFSTSSAPARLKDDFPESFAVVDRILDGELHTVREALDMASAESIVISYGVFERYGFSPDVSEAFSIADVLEEHMFANQKWELSDVHTAIGVGYPAVAMTLPASRPLPKKTETFTYGMVWSRIHLHAARKKMTHAIHTQRAESQLVGSMPIADLALVRQMVLACEKQKDYTTLKRILHGMRPDGILAIMRLWKGGYTQSMHSRVCKNIT